MSLLLSLFTGSSKWLYIALIALSIAFIGVSSLSISLYGDKSALSLQSKTQANQITKLTSDNKELLIKVSSKSKEIDLLNELAKQNAIDKDKKIEEEKKSSLLIKEKYRLLIDQINNVKVDENATTCYEVVNSFFNRIYP